MKKFMTLKVILSVLLIVTWLGGGAAGYFYHTSKTKVINAKDLEIKTLNDNITQIGQLVTAYTVSANVKTGKKIEDTDLTPIQVPTSMATNLILDSTELVGKYYKLDLTAGTVITKDSIYEVELTDDMRLFDVVLHSIPVGLKAGSFVDIRIALPLGEDFIAIPHKQVKAINGGVLKLAINEQDIHVYNSMLIDSLLYPGTQLYAVEYLEGGVQKGADAFYPMSKNILAIAQKDPNLINAIKSDIIKRRDSLETGLSKLEDPDAQKESLDLILERGKEKYKESVKEAEREHQVQLEKQAEIDRQNAALTGQ